MNGHKILACAGYLGHPFMENDGFRERMSQVASTTGMESGGTQLLSGSSDGMLRWCALKRGECVRVRKAHQGTIQSLKRNPDGLLLASYGMTALSTSGIWRAAITCARCCEIGPKSGSISAG